MSSRSPSRSPSKSPVIHKPKSPKKSSSKYASKLANELIDSVIERKLASITKNSKVTHKWLKKMKLSLLRKISSCSKVAFLSEEEQPDTIRAEIENEKEKLLQLRESIKEKTTEKMKKANFAVLPASLKKSGKYTSGAFQPRIEGINKLLTQVAHRLNSVDKTVKERIQSLQTTYMQVDNNWKTKKPTMKDPSKSTKSAKSSSPKKNKTSSTLDRLEAHLDK